MEAEPGLAKSWLPRPPCRIVLRILQAHEQRQKGNKVRRTSKYKLRSRV